MLKTKIIIPGKKIVTCRQRIWKLFVIENWVTDGNEAGNRDLERWNKLKREKVDRHEITPECHQGSGYPRPYKLQGADNTCP
jgi:hypothetical protein